MDAHIANETKHLMTHGNRNTLAMVHVIIPDECLKKAGIEPARLSNRHRASPSTTPAFRVFTQTRYHATGKCSLWRTIFAGYVQRGAIASALVPTIPSDHPRLFQSTPDSGGLFVSLEIECDADGRFDAFTIVALRIDITDDSRTTEILFTYDELLPPGTRYGADSARIALLCRQFVAYVNSHSNVSDSAIKAASHIEATFAEDLKSTGCHQLSQGSRINPTEYLFSGGGFDNNQVLARLEEDDKEIMSLIRRASEVIAKRNPVRVLNTQDRNGASLRRKCIASGLKQGAIGAHAPGSSTRDGASHSSQEGTALLLGLEPPDSGRFVNSGSRRHLPQQGPKSPVGKDCSSGAIDDVLLLTPENSTPLTPLDWLDVGHAAVAGGDTPVDVWRRRPISLVARKHYGTCETFVVVSYENSTAWGGRRARDGHLTGSINPAVLQACVAVGVDHPRNLPPETRAALIAQFPMLRIPLGDTPPPVAAFDAAAELALIEHFRKACVSALLAAISERLRVEPRMSQLIEYDIPNNNRDCIISVAQRAPELLEAVALAIQNVSIAEFCNSALMLAALSHLNILSKNNHGRIPYHKSWLPSLAGGPDAFIFDYYSSGGEVIKVSHVPLAILVSATRTGQHSCKFARGEPGVSAKTYERYLPGECYAYICVGLNRSFDAIVVLPGGFACRANASRKLAWPAHLIEPILERYCWTIPSY
ncbi:DNA packaging tegument protein UL17 [Equid alphaherpesvirus 4]|uniref:DNA packaging tegument protein UL17 n=1 Tax=Equid alphaherpesvirus 4 TaxID=10331 RepID=A0A0X9ZJS7_9ALPH|nr:DNA packaging tegument protein UL17 [Equid alphaherpesvirus 4]AMB16006.1 DNA packaging tegument protein UL17 [Equid alphaherpesvirus 4]AMB16638.1 DNA packaging tegument protein UL17 [Equid alphaherpesvirus 4]AMB16717.1 DNA packaging tegument protein UL17 [Equid alphaherpesvirus 4]AMB16875.1 DNA packaging tegument protein UL17 [Equid alphaherpesvirus 4]